MCADFATKAHSRSFSMGSLKVEICYQQCIICDKIILSLSVIIDIYVYVLILVFLCDELKISLESFSNLSPTSHLLLQRLVEARNSVFYDLSNITGHVPK